MKIDDILKNSLESLGIDFTDREINLTKHYLDICYEYNKSINIIGTKEKTAILKRHFIDCLSILKYINNEIIEGRLCKKIIDIGTGAGLPGMLLAIFLYDSEVYLVDKKLKIINFLEGAISELSLLNVKLLRGRAEEIVHDSNYREVFDLVVARAFGKFNILSEISIPFCRTGGRVILYKSRKVSKELNEFGSIIQVLGGEVEKFLDIEVPYLNEYRTLLVISKKRSSLYKYPRKYDKIKKEPII
jgi:16S rRNA (guanine527-N7)-methyltransferase